MNEIEKVRELMENMELKEVIKQDDISIIKYSNPGPEFIKIQENQNVVIFRNLETKSTKFYFPNHKKSFINDIHLKSHFVSPFE